MINKVKVVICGKDYTMQTAETPNYVYGLARVLEGKINSIMDRFGVSQYNAAIMVSLSVLDDLSKANKHLEQISDQAKSYVDEAGQARIERDTALKEMEVLRSRIAQLESELRLKRLKNSIPDEKS